MVQQAPEQHGGDRGHRVRFEQVCGHTRAIADVVSHVVRDHRGIARVILGDAHLHLAHEVSADIGGFRVDAAAEAGEHGDQGRAKSESDQRIEVVEDAVCDHHAEQSEADDDQSGDRAATKCEAQRGIDAAACRLGRTYVGTHRDVHPDVAGGAAQYCSHQKEHARLPAQGEREEDIDGEADRGDDRVLTVQVCGCSFLDRARDLLHTLGSGWLAKHPDDEKPGPDQGENACGTDGQEDDAIELGHASSALHALQKGRRITAPIASMGPQDCTRETLARA